MKRYTPERKEAALARVRAGESEQKVADDLGIKRGTINSWKRRGAKAAEVAIPEPSGDVEAVDSDRSTEYIAWLGRLRAGQQTLENRVTAANAMAVAAYVSFGKDLIEAKGAVKHGEWLPLLDELGIGHDTAEQLMNIAAHDYIANSEHARNLPPHQTTLAELARLDPAQVEEAVDAGEVTPDSQRVDVRVVVNRRLDALPPEAEHERKPSRPRKKVTTGLTRRLNLIIDTTDDEIPDYIAKFPTMYDELFGLIEKARDRLVGLARVMEGAEGTDRSPRPR